MKQLANKTLEFIVGLALPVVGILSYYIIPGTVESIIGPEARHFAEHFIAGAVTTYYLALASGVYTNQSKQEANKTLTFSKRAQEHNARNKAMWNIIYTGTLVIMEASAIVYELRRINDFPEAYLPAKFLGDLVGIVSSYLVFRDR